MSCAVYFFRLNINFVKEILMATPVSSVKYFNFLVNFPSEPGIQARCTLGTHWVFVYAIWVEPVECTCTYVINCMDSD